MAGTNLRLTVVTFFYATLFVRGIVLFIVVFHLISSPVSSIRFHEGGYTGIRVVIHHSIPEDPEIIENLKGIFTKASKILYTALRGKAYFRDVTIIVPSDWSLNNVAYYGFDYKLIYGDHHFSTADVQVGKGNNYLYLNRTYTVQPGFCGEPGIYIHLIPEYIKGAKDDIDKAARTLVHEWAHLRYGVFNEYELEGDLMHPVVYEYGMKIWPTACVVGINGLLTSADEDRPCELDEQGFGLPSCRYIPDVRNARVKASLMAYPSLPHVKHFCTDDKDKPDSLHNRRAPNKHNRMCKSRSTWDVITSHEDFKGVSCSLDLNEGVSTIPIFTILREHGKARIVLLLETSERMGDHSMMEYLKEATTRFLRVRVPNYYYIGIIHFTNTASELSKGLVYIKRGGVLNDSIARIGKLKSSCGSPNIANGLQKSLKMLQKEQGGLIVIVFNGHHNKICRHLFQQISQRHIVVSVISLSTSKNKALKKIVGKTGGVWHSFDAKERSREIPPRELDDAFFSVLMSQTSVDQQPVVILKESVKLSPRDMRRLQFNIDHDFQWKVTVIIVWGDGDYCPKISFTNPDNEFTKGQNPQMYPEANIVFDQLYVPKPGRWILNINSTVDKEIDLDVEVLAEVLSDQQPIRVHSWLKAQKISKCSSIIRIFAEVRRKYDPVVDASVIASVKTPDNQIINISLKDDGTGADVTKNDGIYSEYFTSYRRTGLHHVFIRVSSDNNTRIRTGSKSSGVPPFPKDASSKNSKEANLSWSNVRLTRHYERRKEFEGDFPAVSLNQLVQRYRYLGSFEITDKMVNASKCIPPNRVTDLRVLWTFMTRNALVATLRWTSPGDDMQTGNASWIELRGSSDWDQLQDSFSTAHQFTNVSELENPLPGGSIQTTDVVIPSYLAEGQLHISVEGELYISFYFAMRAHDKDKNAGDVSNIASARFSPLWNIPIQEFESSAMQKNVSFSNSVISRNRWLTVIVIWLWFGVLTAVVIATVYIAVKKALEQAIRFDLYAF